jgi:hypothetical protein
MTFQDLIATSRFHIGQKPSAARINSVLFFDLITLPFDMEHQTEHNWCWAATATSVARFYHPASVWTQCTVANGNLTLQTCCNSPVPDECDVTSSLKNALEVTSNFASRIANKLDYDAIQAELRDGRVIGARTEWSVDDAHFVVIHGCSRVGLIEWVDIDDPLYGKSHVTLEDFTNNYRGIGRWTHTYLTKRWPDLKVKFPPVHLPFAELIENARPMFALKRGDREAAAKPGGLTLAMQHQVFVLDVKDLSDNGEPTLREPVATRVLEVEGGVIRAIFDMTPAGREPARVQSMTDDLSTLELLQRALSEVSRLAEQRDGEPELRFISIVALQVEAFWLHYRDKSKDVVVPVRAPRLFRPLSPLPATEFFSALRTSARERKKPVRREDDFAP